MSKEQKPGNQQDANTPGLSLQRLPGNQAGRCDACLTDEKLIGMKADSEKDIKDVRLIIDFPITYMVLCAMHEGELLSKLLNNYVKRIHKGGKVGFLGMLRKDDPVKQILQGREKGYMGLPEEEKDLSGKALLPGTKLPLTVTVIPPLPARVEEAKEGH